MSDFKMIQAVVSSDSLLRTETVVWMDIKIDVFRRPFYMKRMTDSTCCSDDVHIYG